MNKTLTMALTFAALSGRPIADSGRPPFVVNDFGPRAPTPTAKELKERWGAEGKSRSLAQRKERRRKRKQRRQK